MKKSELVYREVLRSFLEVKKAKFTQLGLARALRISLSTVSNALQPLRRMGAVRVKRRSFEVVNAKKVLYYWASARSLDKDVIYKTRADMTVSGIEKGMPPQVVFAAYTAYKFRFEDVPADYSEVYVYCGENDLKEVVKRFPQGKNPNRERSIGRSRKSDLRSNPNVFVLRKDFADKEMPLAQMFIDLWNLKEWYAKDFLTALEGRMHEILA
ncbi:winged helix-turn-helix domain-containing protein [Candidatus Woesearchaeota archaeon]|nr:winged helix-turn-helix domain-containing protein [Candidatus Woesearchaeota archaeon]